MTKLSVSIVGSGPSALATARELIASGRAMEITIFDCDNVEEPVQKVGLKSYFGSFSMYDQTDLSHKDMKPVTWPSASKGGFSRIWGAVIGESIDDNFANYINFNDIKFDSFLTISSKKIINKYNLRKIKKWQTSEHNVAVDPNSCTMCGQCLSGCPTNAIWFAGDYWKEFKQIQYENKYRLEYIELEGKSVLLHSNDGQTRKCDVLFLAAGPISSAKILIKSKLISNEVTFDDTQAIFFPAIRRPVRENGNSFALSQISASFVSPKIGRNYIQLYPDSRNLSDSISLHKPITGKLIALVWKYFSPFVATGILYRESEVSPRLILRRDQDQNFILTKSRQSEMSKKRSFTLPISWSIFQDFGVLPLLFLGKTSEPGESYHFGSSAEILRLNSICINVKVVDASALPEVLPGPITSYVMSNAKKIVRDTLEGMR